MGWPHDIEHKPTRWFRRIDALLNDDQVDAIGGLGMDGGRG